MQEISRAELLRQVSGEQQKKVIAAFEKASSARPAEQLACFIHALGMALVWGISYLPEIAAELAEANSRDREAEIRAKNAEAFVTAIQAELAKQHIVVPGGVRR